MLKCVNVLLAVAVVLAVPAMMAMAADGPEKAGETPKVESMPLAKGIAILGASFGASFCAVAGGLGIARIGSSCLEAISRQPEAAGAMFAPMIITAAMAEGGMLFAIVVCLLGVLA